MFISSIIFQEHYILLKRNRECAILKKDFQISLFEYRSMQISYYGLSCFRVSTKPAGRATDEVVMYLDPINEKGMRAVYGKMDIIACSQGKDACSADTSKGEVMILDFPGEYATRGIDIIGIDASSEKETNTIFIFESEDVRIAHMGRLRGELTEKHLDALAETDILLIPIGGGEFINTKVALSVIRKLEPKVVIPMLYQMPNVPYMLDDEKKFLSEMGADGVQRVDKFVFKAKDIEEKKSEVVLLSSQR